MIVDEIIDSLGSNKAWPSNRSSDTDKSCQILCEHYQYSPKLPSRPKISVKKYKQP